MQQKVKTFSTRTNIISAIIITIIIIYKAETIP